MVVVLIHISLPGLKTRKNTYVEVTGAMIMPASHRIDEPRRIMFTNKVCEYKIGAHIVNPVVILPRLTPTFIVDNLHTVNGCPGISERHDAYPCYNTGIALMLFDQQCELPIKFVLHILLQRRCRNRALRLMR